jgi:hypothetical protein
METTNLPNPMIEEGKTLLSLAKEEINKAEEDVVTFLICHSLRKAITGFLSGFLNYNGEAPVEAPIAALQQRCAAYDGRFSDLDLSVMECRSEGLEAHDCYCFDPEKARLCVELASRIEGMVTEEAPMH